MQLTPSTAHGIAMRTGGNAFHTSDLYNADINIRYGAWYLRNLFDKYGSEELVLAAYNAGQGNVDRWRANGRVDPVRRDEGVRRARRAPEGRLPAGVGQGARRAE